MAKKTEEILEVEKEEKKVVEKEEKKVKVILLKGNFNYNGENYEAGTIPILIVESIAKQLIKKGVAIIPKLQSK